MRKLLSFIWLVTLAIWPLHTHAQNFPEYTATEVNDFAGILPAGDIREIEAMLRQAKFERDLEMTVVVINSRLDYGPSPSIEKFAKDLFNEWGVGNAERNDGILMLIAVQDREMRIALGAGYPAIYDGIATRIIDSIMLPEFRAGRYPEGIVKGTEAALDRIRLSDPNAPLTSPDRWATPFSTTKERFQSNPIIAAILGVLGLGGFGFGWRTVLRRRPRKCPECGRKMIRLGNVQEDNYLNHGQLVEERLQSKDYDVWLCPYDEHVSVISYGTWFSRHKACPNCGYKAYETKRTVLDRATEYSTGTARLDHECRNCHHRDTQTVTIPTITRSKSRGSSSGRSGGGGGFGGGRSSGGGGSGRW